MSYARLFDPDSANAADLEARGYRLGDRRDDTPYVFDEAIVLAVNVALATGRPLLVAGEPGTGKSSLAAAVATRLGWRFYARTISSRTQARDLLWTFDTVRRLSDAQVKDALRHPAAYIEPGVLWWAFDPVSAARRGLSQEDFDALRGTPREASTAAYPTPNETAPRAVVLLDEIDKADPDVPNDLLEPLGSFSFRVIEGDVQRRVTAAQAPLVFITTNDERDLPKAFVRRCVHLEIQAPTEENERLLAIARAHFPNDQPGADGKVPLHAHVSTEYFKLRKAATGRRPSTAEYLDAVSACRELGLTPEDPAWTEVWPRIVAAALTKPRESAG